MKISKAKLIESVKAQLVKEQGEYEKSMQEYLAAFKETRKGVVTALKEAVSAAESASEYAHLSFLESDRYSGYGKLSVPISGVSLPRRPEQNQNIKYTEQDLRMLEMCAEETITVREHDRFARYI